MPRLSFGYRLGEKMVVKGGYGMYYDTLNARDWTPNLRRLRRHDHEPAQ